MVGPYAPQIHKGDFIGGRFVPVDVADGEYEVRCPADVDEVLHRISYCRGHIDLALAAAAQGQRVLWALGLEGRTQLLRGYQAALRTHHDSIASTIALEIGKPLWEAKTEVDAMIAKVDLALGPGAAFTQDQSIAELPGEIRYRPLGTMAVVGPFNFPGHLPNGHIVPALLLGNSVIFKPSEHAPGTASWIARCLHEAGCPAGAFNVVHGDGLIGKQLCSHDAVNGVLFTGSVRVGRDIVASNLTRLDKLIALEMGGKNAAIAFDDCDLERTARMVAFSAYVTAGQRCTASSRLIVTRGIANALCERISEMGRTLKVGHPLSQDVFMGPVITQQTMQKLMDATAAARAAGATPLLFGGHAGYVAHRGHYVLPSLHRFDDPQVHVEAYTDEELFGPDLAVYVVDNEEDAWQLANASRFGLSASVFTASQPRFERACEQLRVGVVHWNRPGAGASGRLPFAGLKASGNHRPAGILAGTTCSYAQAVLLPHVDTATSPLPTWPGFPAEHD